MPTLELPVCPACAGNQFRDFARKGAFAYLQCQACGLLAIDPMPSEGEIEEHYRRKFEGGNYSTIRQFATEYLTIYRQYLDWMRGLARVDGARLLDIGCFTRGDFLQVSCSRRERADAFGVELQAEAVALAQGRWPGRVFQHNIDHPMTELPDGSLEIVTLMALIEHVQQPLHLLRRVRELLRPGGWRIRAATATPDQ